jgi:phosphoribosyl-ATP pyrophosphohydrolase
MDTITKRLPPELIRYIKEYIPKKEFVFTNKVYYNLYHSLITPTIKDYESYVRAMIRQDNEFVFKKIIEENFSKWYQIRQYKYKNMIFNNYLYFVMNFCIENESNNCRKTILEFLKEHGLGKNLHKKNIVKYIKWKN